MALANPTSGLPGTANEVPAHVCEPDAFVVCTTLLLALVGSATNREAVPPKSTVL